MDEELARDEGRNELTSPGKTGRIPLIVVRKINDRARVIVAAFFDLRP